MNGLLVDGRSAGAHGIGRFTREVLRRLPEADVIEGGGSPNSFWDPVWLWREVERRRPRIFLSPSFVVPIASRAAVIPTIHDLIHLSVDEESNTAHRVYYQQVLRPTVRKGPLVFTVSEASRSAIIDWADVDAERVVVVGNGVGPPFEPDGPRTVLAAPFVLMVGGSKPHKNVHRALAAFARSKASLDHFLCIRGTEDRRLVDAAHEQNIGDRLMFVAQLDDPDLASLYRGAACLLMPSVAEGFGLPALEALACGTPVVGSRGTAIEEVVADAGVLVDPENVEDVAAGIDIATTSRDPDLVQRGIDRAARFTWDAVGGRIRDSLLQLDEVSVGS